MEPDANAQRAAAMDPQQAARNEEIVGAQIIDKGITGAPVPPTQPLPNIPWPPIGSLVMALVPSAINPQWQMASIVHNPDGSNIPAVQFSDMSLWRIDAVQISQPVAPTSAVDTAAPNTRYAVNASAISTLQPRYSAFLKDVTALFDIAETLFQMPLQSVITMAYRQANRSQLVATGKMDVIGEAAVFVPDGSTFERWMLAYLEEVQRREVERGGPEA